VQTSNLSRANQTRTMPSSSFESGPSGSRRQRVDDDGGSSGRHGLARERSQPRDSSGGAFGDLVEGLLLDAFEGKPPFSRRTRGRIAAFSRFHGLTLRAADSHRLREHGAAVDGA